MIPSNAVAWQPLNLLERLAFESLDSRAEKKLWISRFVSGQPGWTGWTYDQKFAMILAGVKYFFPDFSQEAGTEEVMAHEIRYELGIKYRPPWARGRDPDPDRAKPWTPA